MFALEFHLKFSEQESFSDNSVNRNEARASCKKESMTMCAGSVRKLYKEIKWIGKQTTPMK